MLEESVHLDTAVVRSVIMLSNRWIDHEDKLLLMIVQVLDNLTHPVQREAIRVEREDPAMVHVVNVCPHRPGISVSIIALIHAASILLHWDSGCRVVGDDLSHLEPILVSVLALMELNDT